MPFTNIPDRSYETTKFLRRSKGVFSKIRRTLTSPPQFRIGQLSGPEGFTTAALFERCFNRLYIDYNIVGTVTPAHKWKNRSTDVGYALTLDWKPSPFSFKGRVSCKRTWIIKQFLSDRVFAACPIKRYISDRRPRGRSLQQLAFAACYIVTRGKTSLLRILNGTVGYRNDSEDSNKSPGRYCWIRNHNVHKTVSVKYAVIPYICLERRSTGILICRKDRNSRYPLLNFEPVEKSYR